MTRRWPTRSEADAFFPTLVRYAGLGMILYAVFIDHFQNPAIATAATGMIFFKTVIGRDGNGNGRRR